MSAIGSAAADHMISLLRGALDVHEVGSSLRGLFEVILAELVQQRATVAHLESAPVPSAYVSVERARLDGMAKMSAHILASITAMGSRRREAAS